jgi:hypothetical protein
VNLYLQLREAHEATKRVYARHDCGAGGCLHSIIDDGNMDNVFFEGGYLEHLDGCSRERAVEEEAAFEALRELPAWARYMLYEAGWEK